MKKQRCHGGDKSTNMKVLQKISFPEVLKAFDQEHSVKEGTNDWARKRLEDANKKFGGEWYRIKLSRREALNILLVWHHDTREGLMLISEGGSTVRDVANYWKEIKDDYRKKNKSCYEKIMRFSKDAFSSVFLSVKPITGYGVAEYEKLKYRNGTLVHLDGLHRLIGWAIAGRFKWFRYYFSKKKVGAFVAGPVG